MNINKNSMYEEKSFWLRQFGNYEPNASLNESIEADIAIIGAGFSGLSTAYEFKKLNPNADVVVIESHVVGYGASGRNGGFSMKLFGLEPEITVMRWGESKTKEANEYMFKAVAHVKDLIQSNNLQSDYMHTGMFRVAYGDKQTKRLEKTYRLFERLGTDRDMSWWTKEKLNAHFLSDRFKSGIYETETGILNPCKHVRELKKLCESVGVKIYETTPALDINEDTRIRIDTPKGHISSEKLVVCTNAYSHLLHGVNLGKKQFPGWSHQVVTEPLTDKQWESIGWKNRESFEDNRQLVHYFRPTVDGRITMGGGTVDTAYGTNMDKDNNEAAWMHCEQHLKWLYPQLEDLQIAYRWGGPVSVNMDMTPEIGFLNSERIIYTSGCIGHGVSLTQLNGKLIAQLLNGDQTDLTDFWIVKRKAIRLPGSLLSWVGANIICKALNTIDRFEERHLDSPR